MERKQKAGLPEEYISRNSSRFRKMQSPVKQYPVKKEVSPQNSELLSMKDKIEQQRKRRTEPLEKQSYNYQRIQNNLAQRASSLFPPPEKMRETLKKTLTSIEKLAIKAALKYKRESKIKSFFTSFFK